MWCEMQADPRGDILVAGDANVDLILEDSPPLALDEEKLARGFALTLGGSSSITAFNLACLGARTGFVGVVGDDLFGRYVEERLKWAGVDVRALRKSARVQSGLTVWHLRGERRAGVTVEGTIRMLRANDVRAEDLGRYRHLHVGCYFLLKRFQSGAAALFRRARKMGLTTSLDSNYDPSEQWDSGIFRTLRHVDVFFPNEIEAKRLTGKRDAKAAARELARYARIVAVKRGARGAWIHSAQGAFAVPAVRVKKAVDSTGAGDSFNAGFLTRFVRGESIEKCARAGARAGARAVTRVGGTTAFEAPAKR